MPYSYDYVLDLLNLLYGVIIFYFLSHMPLPLERQ